jgi:hypothetical protein
MKKIIPIILIITLFFAAHVNAQLSIDSGKAAFSVDSGKTATSLVEGPIYYTPTAAFSNHRLPGSDSTIPVMKVRRVIPGDEKDAYDFRGTKVLYDNGWIDQVSETLYVVTWYDQSGNGNHATQTTAASQPGVAFIERNATGLGSELHPNPGMETDTVWVDKGTPIVNEQSTEQVHSGTYSRKFSADSQYDGITDGRIINHDPKVYKISGWIYGDGVNAVFFRLYENPALTVHYLTTGGVGGEVIPAAWTYYEKYVSLTSENPFGFEIQGGTSVTSGTWYVDDVSFKEVTDPVITLDFDGTDDSLEITTGLSNIIGTSGTMVFGGVVISAGDTAGRLISADHTLFGNYEIRSFTPSGNIFYLYYPNGTGLTPTLFSFVRGVEMDIASTWSYDGADTALESFIDAVAGTGALMSGFVRAPDTALTIGAWSGQYSDIKIRNVSFYSEVLSQNEIIQLHNYSAAH